MKIRYSILLLILGLIVSCQKFEPVADNQASDSSASKAILRAMLQDRDTQWTEDDLNIPSENAGWKEINDASELAFLLEFGSTSGEKYRLAADINVAASELAEKFKSEIGVERFENFEFDGNGKTLSGLDLPWAAGVFSVVKNAKIYNLTIANSKVGSEENISNLNGTGTLFGSASGNLQVSGVNVQSCVVLAPCKVGGLVGSLLDVDATFSGCNVNGTDVATIYVKGVSGWCGGFVGFVGREVEKNTESAVSVIAENCSVTGGNVKAHMESSTRYSGTFLGTLNGYDANEAVDLKNCQVTTTFVGLDSKASSYVSIYPDRKVGGHKYMNGNLCFDGLNYVTPWDGTTTKQPKLVDGTYQVYTAEELAWFQDKEVTDNIQICNDIDLGGHLFLPLKKASYIDGQKSEGKNYEIRNLKVVRTNCGKEDGGAFIRQASGTTVHKNITFRGADIKATHDPDADHGNAYCATLCGNMTGTYTMENVHAIDGKLYGVNKMGGLLGRVYATATIKNCSVSGYTIENYEVNDKPEVFEKTVSFITVKATFYPQGEIGGMIGFIQASANISNCHVYNSMINATGQKDNKDYVIVTIPGRHIGTVIGDIRTSIADHVVTINNCSSDDATRTYAKSHWLDEQSGATFIGKCYAVPVIDTKGKVIVDGKSISY